MRALSLTNPWAVGVRDKLKHWETRSWPTKVRGEIAIHAAKGFPGWARDFAASQSIAILPEELGAIVCVATLTDCLPTETVVQMIDEREKRWGDYSAGRYAYKLENIRVLHKPVKCAGALGFWVVDWDLHRLISQQLVAA
jgi:hypothetical protein